MKDARFKYEFLNGRVRYVVDEGAHTRLYESWPGKEPEILDPHPFGIWTGAAERSSLRLGFRAHARVAHDLMRLFETEATPKRYIGGWLYEATVQYESETLDIEVNVFARKIVRINRRVAKFATDHAIARAKERYDLVLDAETAEAIIRLLTNGQSKTLDGGRDGLERAELVYDSEVFTVVWNPENAKIVTVTPTGGYWGVDLA